MKLSIIKACSDLGVHINGSNNGPKALNKFDNLVDNIYEINKENIEKELEKDNKKKNIKALNKFNEKLYNTIINDKNNFCITLGGDHSIAIASALASKKKNNNIGIIWIDSHSDFHDFSSTISGNIHGMPFATICNQNGSGLSYFFDENYFNPQNSVLVGARDIEDGEYKKLKEAGIKIFTTNDIKEQGAKNIIKKAIEIAKNNTLGIHISYDLDVIDPIIAPGVSIKAKDGITKEDAFEILDEIINNKELIKSFDLVELNPNYDIENKTEIIANTILEKLINEIKKINE